MDANNHDARGISFLGERLKYWRKSLNIKGIELAMLISISQGGLSSIENGNSLPSAETIAKLHERTNINIIWLLTGQGEMTRRDKSQFEEKNGEFLGNLEMNSPPIKNEVVEHFIKVFGDSSREKKAKILGFLDGADESPGG